METVCAEYFITKLCNFSLCSPSGEDEVDQQQGKMPSLKHVMNPEGRKTRDKICAQFSHPSSGRMTEWEDVSKEDQPNMEQMMVHAAPNLNTPDPIAESLNAEAGKGEPSLSRPSTFVSAYRRVFEQNRVVFGAQEVGGSGAKMPESPRLQHKAACDTPSPSWAGPKLQSCPQITNKNTPATPATPNPNKNRAQRGVTIVDSKDSIVKVGRGDKRDLVQDMVEMKPVTVRIKDATEQPTAPPRKAHFAAIEPASKAKDAKMTTPCTPIVPHFKEVQKPLDNQPSVSFKSLNEVQKPLDNQPTVTFKPLDNRINLTENRASVLDNRTPLKRHASFNDKCNLDNRQARRSIWEEKNNNLNMTTRPSDVLKTPYLLSSSNRALHHSSSQNFGNFPHIPGTSMVAKTKALFEGATEGNLNRNFAPLTKSRTFSSFPTSNMQEMSSAPLSPSVPQRSSSRKAVNCYKSMNGNINDYDTDGSSSPATQRRIPIGHFF